MNLLYDFKLLAAGTWFSLTQALRILIVEIPFAPLVIVLFYLITCNWPISLIFFDILLMVVMRASTYKKNYEYILLLVPKIASMFVLVWIVSWTLQLACHSMQNVEYIIKLLLLIPLTCSPMMVLYSPLVLVPCYLILEIASYRFDSLLLPTVFYSFAHGYIWYACMFFCVSSISYVLTLVAVPAGVMVISTLLLHILMMAWLAACVTVSLHAYDARKQLG